MSPSGFAIFFIVLTTCHCFNFKLEQVLILSRHNVRTPLSRNLFEYTPKTWPNWKEKNGYLTAKGELLEGFMGEFFSSWLIKENVLSKNCPSKKYFYVYANNKQRTMASAAAFINKAFPLCNITIHHSVPSQNDPIFNPIVHNASKSFRIAAMEQMQALLNSLYLNTSEESLEKILDYKNSKYCLNQHKCNLVSDYNKIFLNVGYKPNLEGPLKISKSVIDSFIMENYEGFSIDKVAWGMLKSLDQWNAIMDLSRGYHNVIFNTTLVAKDLARPLLNFINELLINRGFKVTFLMGHDANLYTVLKTLQVKPYVLKYQYENIPAGGKLVFQKWKNQSTNELYAKLDYVYQSTEQMREGKSLSMSNPPEFTCLKFEDCEIDENGFCPWADFMKLLDGALND